jgi:lipoprotein-anchoring transpeptidase ErfK/SrfK
MKRKTIKQHHVLSTILVVLVGTGLYFVAIGPDKAVSVVLETPPVKDIAIEPEAPITPPESNGSKVSYRSIVVTSDKPGAEIAQEVGLSKVPFVLTFNRLDDKHISKNTTITIPSELTDWNALSPFPSTLDAAKDIPKLLLVSQRIQAIGAYEHGILVRWMVTSTGKKDTPTPSKLYFTNWKGKLVVSSIQDEWILPWYFNLDNTEGISLHQYELPGYPASHSCVRMTEADAQWVYDWAQQWILSADENTKLASGTPVIVFGEYGYGKTAPWKKLAKDSSATTLTTDELNTLITENLPAIQKEAANRASVEAGS